MTVWTTGLLVEGAYFRLTFFAGINCLCPFCPRLDNCWYCDSDSWGAMVWLGSMSSTTQVYELVLLWFGQRYGKHLPLPWYLYLACVKKQPEITGGKEWDGRNWANLERFLRLPAAGLVL